MLDRVSITVAISHYNFHNISVGQKLSHVLQLYGVWIHLMYNTHFHMVMLNIISSKTAIYRAMHMCIFSVYYFCALPYIIHVYLYFSVHYIFPLQLVYFCMKFQIMINVEKDNNNTHNKRTELSSYHPSWQSRRWRNSKWISWHSLLPCGF